MERNCNSAVLLSGPLFRFSLAVVGITTNQGAENEEEEEGGLPKCEIYDTFFILSLARRQKNGSA